MKTNPLLEHRRKASQKAKTKERATRTTQFVHIGLRKATVDMEIRVRSSTIQARETKERADIDRFRYQEHRAETQNVIGKVREMPYLLQQEHVLQENRSNRLAMHFRKEIVRKETYATIGTYVGVKNSNLQLHAIRRQTFAQTQESQFDDKKKNQQLLQLRHHILQRTLKNWYSQFDHY